MSSCEGRMTSKPGIQNVNAPISSSVSGLAYLGTGRHPIPPGLALPQHRHSPVSGQICTRHSFPVLTKSVGIIVGSSQALGDREGTGPVLTTDIDAQASTKASSAS